MESLEPVITILEHRGHRSLARLLSRARVEFDISNSYGSFLFSLLTTAEIYAPLSDYDRLQRLPSEDNKHILDALLEVWPAKAHEMEITWIVYRLDATSLIQPTDETEELLIQLDRLRSLMIAVSTGGPRIDRVNDEYKEDHQLLTRRLQKRGLANPVLYADLWDWYGKWSSGDLPTYQSRREFVNDLFRPLQQRIRAGDERRSPEIFLEPTGWARIDRTLARVQSSLSIAETEEQFQAVGLLCREALISLAQTVFDPDRHPALDDAKVSDTDAKRMLDRFLAAELIGKSNAAARRLAKTSLDLANELQHERTASFRKAALCAEATAAVINVMAVLAGARDTRAGAA